MRLLNTESQILGEFYGELPTIDDDGVGLTTQSSLPIPHYAILSHCWREGEVLFKDIRDLDRARGMPGFPKINHCCRAASKIGYEWLWVDTCCIDKTSSAELSEAINSMFKWYRHADMCLVYLDDVDDEDPHPSYSSFRTSRWFTRGWTLQELLAPWQVVFFSKSWSFLGTKQSLLKLLSSITRIPEDALSHQSPFSTFSIAQRMSWAAKRKTTRIEDHAYSLMGLFDIFMPILYGEGASAFRRLQLEIMQQSNDQTIFAWSSGVASPFVWPSLSNSTPSNANKTNPPEATDSLSHWRTDHSYILAPSPAYFNDSGSVVSSAMLPRAESLDKLPEAMMVYSWTHLGLHIRMPLISAETVANDSQTYLGLLSCRNTKERSSYGLMLMRDATQEGLYHCRILRVPGFTNRLVIITEDCVEAISRVAVSQDVYISNQPSLNIPDLPPRIMPNHFVVIPAVNPLVVIPNFSIKRLKGVGFSLAGHHFPLNSSQDVEVQTDSGGGILVGFRTNHYRYIFPPANLLFLNKTTNQAFSVFFGFSHTLIEEFYVDIAFHRSKDLPTPLTAKAAHNQYRGRGRASETPGGIRFRLSRKMSKAAPVTQVFCDHTCCLLTTASMWGVYRHAKETLNCTAWVELSLSECTHARSQESHDAVQGTSER